MKASHEMLAKILKDALLSRTLRNSSYSLRALARDLSLSPATLSGFLSGKRKMSSHTARSILEALACPPEQIEIIIGSWPDSYYSSIDSKMENLGIEALSFDLLTILSYMETKDFDGSAEAIAHALGMPRDLVLVCLRHLSELNAVHLDNGKYKVIRPQFSTLEKEIGSKNLAAATDGLMFVDRFVKNADAAALGNLCDLSLMFIPSSAAKVADAKNRIKVFRRRLARVMESRNKSTSFLLAISLVPMTGWEKK